MHLLKRVFPKLNQQPKLNVLPHVVEGTCIPKLIHQTYADTELPVELQQNQQHLQTMNPGWEYRFYRDKDIIEFISKHYGPEMLSYYNRINPIYGAARADLFRYLVVYKCGGVYLDIKSSLNVPFDDFLLDDDRYLTAQWENEAGEEFAGWGFHYDLRNIKGGEFQQWHIAAAAGHPFLRSVLQNVLKNIDLYIPALHAVGKRGVVRVTGPIAYTLAITPLLATCKHRIITRQNPFPFKYSIYPYDAHIGLLSTHYSKRTAPVVEIGTLKNLYSTLLEALNRVDDWIRSKPSSMGK
jgi:hypothetical protein